jgi:hypothetical protein
MGDNRHGSQFGLRKLLMWIAVAIGIIVLALWLLLLWRLAPDLLHFIKTRVLFRWT